MFFSQKMLSSVKLLAKYLIIIYALGWHMKSSASESELFQSRSKAEISAWARWEEQLSFSKF